MANMSSGGGDGAARESFGSSRGFILAAVGSAVGLGNMWRFSYTAAEGGGAAFVFLYIALTLLIGIPIMLAEMAAGRSGRLSPIGALRKAGGKGWAPMGFLYVLSGLLILSYYSVIAGWTVRYAIEAIVSGFPGRFGCAFHPRSRPARLRWASTCSSWASPMAIVMGGVEKGIERASTLMMPALFVILVGLAMWAFTP